MAAPVRKIANTVILLTICITATNHDAFMLGLNLARVTRSIPAPRCGELPRFPLAAFQNGATSCMMILLM